MLQIGRLNLLTPARVKAAAAEIKTGEMVRLEYVFFRTFSWAPAELDGNMC